MAKTKEAEKPKVLDETELGRELAEPQVREVNLGVGQSAFVNVAKKEELEAEFPDRYHFTEIEHHGTLSPIEGEADTAFEVRRAEDIEESAEPVLGDPMPEAAIEEGKS
jgi:hypothetical protein